MTRAIDEDTGTSTAADQESAGASAKVDKSKRQAISGFGAEGHYEYSSEAPEGVWTGRLDDLAWGKSSNLFCFFTEEENGAKYRLAVFHRQSYEPYKDGPAFDQEPRGGRFEITTALSKNGLAKFISARKL